MTSKIGDYFNSLSTSFDSSREDFKNLTDLEKIGTVLLSIFAGFATLPFLCIGGFETFNSLVGRFKKVEDSAVIPAGNSALRGSLKNSLDSSREGSATISVDLESSSTEGFSSTFSKSERYSQSGIAEEGEDSTAKKPDNFSISDSSSLSEGNDETTTVSAGYLSENLMDELSISLGEKSNEGADTGKVENGSEEFNPVSQDLIPTTEFRPPASEQKPEVVAPPTFRSTPVSPPVLPPSQLVEEKPLTYKGRAEEIIESCGGNLKNKKNRNALKTLLLERYHSKKNNPYPLIETVCILLLKDKLISFSKKPFLEFWSVLLLDIKELRNSFTQVKVEDGSWNLTEKFYFNQLMINGPYSELTYCFIEDLTSKSEANKIIKIKQLLKIMTAVEFAKKTKEFKEYNEKHASGANLPSALAEAKHNMVLEVLKHAKPTKGSIRWLINPKNDVEESLGQHLNFFEIQQTPPLLDLLIPELLISIIQHACTELQGADAGVKFLKTLKELDLEDKDILLRYFFKTSGCDPLTKHLDLFAIIEEYPDILKFLNSDFTTKILANSVEILRNKKDGDYLIGDKDTLNLFLMINEKIDIESQEKFIIDIIDLLMESPEFFVENLLFDCGALSYLMDGSLERHLRIDTKFLWTKIEQKNKIAMLDKVLDCMKCIESIEIKEDRDQIEKELEKIENMLQCEDDENFKEYLDNKEIFLESLIAVEVENPSPSLDEWVVL